MQSHTHIPVSSKLVPVKVSSCSSLTFMVVGLTPLTVIVSPAYTLNFLVSDNLLSPFLHSTEYVPTFKDGVFIFNCVLDVLPDLTTKMTTKSCFGSILKFKSRSSKFMVTKQMLNTYSDI